MNIEIANIKSLILHYKYRFLIGVLMTVIILVIIVTSFDSGEKIIRPNTTKLDSVDFISNTIGKIQEYDFTEAINHVGEKVRIKGEVVRIFTAKSGVTFFDFCEDFNNCSFSAVIFASDLKKFPNVLQYQRKIVINGLVKIYNGKAEIILKNPEQIE